VKPTLRPIAEDVFCADRPLRIGPVDIGTRMTVLRVRGALFLHSPVPADPATRRAVDELGPVQWIVAPSRVHHLYAGEWKRAYPEARLYGAPGLPAKRNDLDFDAVLDDEPPIGWQGAIDQVVFEGAPAMSEVVFCHRRSRTLLLTDLAMNFRDPRSLWLKLWILLTDSRGFGPSRIVRFTIRDRAAARASMDRILALDFDRITLTHGAVLESGGKEALRRAWEWL